MAVNLSTEPDDYRQRLAMMMVQQGLDSSPIKSPWQGAARLAQALAGSMQMNSIAGDQQAANSRVAEFLMKMGGPGGSPQPGAPQGGDDAGNYGGSPATNPNLAPISPEPPVRMASLSPQMARGTPSPMPPAPTGPMAGPAGPPAPGSFNDRWTGVTDAVKSGDLDPVGQNFHPAFAPQPQAPQMPPMPPVGGPAMTQPRPPSAPAGMPAPMPPQQPQAPQGAPQGQAGGMQDQAIRAHAAQLIADPRVDPTIKQAILGQFLPKDNQIMQLPDGTVLAVNARTGVATPLYKGPPKPQVVAEGASLVSETGQPLFQSQAKPQVVAEGGSLVGPKGEALFQGQPKAPPGYEWAAGGQKELKPIPGGPESKIPSETAGRLAMMDTAASDFAKARAELERPYGVGVGSLPDRAASAAGVGDIGRAQRTIRLAVEATLRAMTGAAAPEQEVSRYADMFTPNQFDKPETAKQKLDYLESFMRNAKGTILQGRQSSAAPSQQQRADPLGIR